MTKLAFLSLLLLGAVTHAADKKTPLEKKMLPDLSSPPPVADTGDFSSYKTADALWKRLEELRETPKVQPKSKEEYVGVITKWFGDQKAAADVFIARYPKDPRRYGAQITALQSSLQLARLPGGEKNTLASPSAVKRQIAEIIAAPDVPEETRGEATFIQTIALSGDVDREKPATITAFFKASSEFLSTYPTHKLAPQMRVAQLQLAGTVDTPDAQEILAQLAASVDTRLSDAAKQTIARKEKMAGLKTKPVELKFTATDGQELNLESLRGKVVLVDFWASWCGPCISEMPNVVAAYEKLHGKGFEIVGISLDQDKAAMDGALAKHKMSWRQYFDGKGWKNEISSTFGITSIPTTWLLDKKGILRETELRGPALAKAVEKLLAE